MKSCGVWQLASPWLSWRQKTEYGGAQGDQESTRFAATALKCFYLHKLNSWKGVKCFCSAHTFPGPH